MHRQDPRTLRAAPCVVTSLRSLKVDVLESVGEMAWHSLLAPIVSSLESEVVPPRARTGHEEHPESCSTIAYKDDRRTEAWETPKNTTAHEAPTWSRHSSGSAALKFVNYNSKHHPQDKHLPGAKRVSHSGGAVRSNKRLRKSD